MTVADTDKEVTDRWLAIELNRIWLVAERALRALQGAQLRPQSGHPLVAEVEGVLAARRAARLGKKKTEGEADLNKAIAAAESQLPALRKAAPIGRLIDNLALRPLEIETMVSAMAPHVDAPLADLFNVLRGVGSGRRGVDLALLAQMYRLKRADRVSLLDAVDPERPLLRWGLVEVLPAQALESFGSLSHRAIRPTFHSLSMLCGRGKLDPELARCIDFHRGQANLDDLRYSEKMAAVVKAVCESSSQEDNVDPPWLLMWGANGAGKRTIAEKAAAYAGKSLVAFDPRVIEKGSFDTIFPRVKAEALIRDAMLYIGPLNDELLKDDARVLTQRLSDYAGMLAIGVDALQPVRVAAEHPINEIQVDIPPEPIRLELWERHIPAARRGPDMRLGLLAMAFDLTPGEIIGIAAEAQAIAEGDKDRPVRHRDVRDGIDRRLRNQLGELAQRVPITVEWEDLVLPDEALDRIQEFVSRRKHSA